ncbi:hypothetical protein VTI28DRAFT_6020 [Corynascus sepedonium]
MPFTRDRGRGRQVDDDDSSVSSDAESISTSSSLSYNREFIPVTYEESKFRLQEGNHGEAVYEAWNIHYSPETQKLGGYKAVLGLKVEKYNSQSSRVLLRGQPSSQADLADMHLEAIEAFRAKHKRSWVMRPFRGKGQTYEQDLDDRCRNLSEDVKRTLTNLLLDRGRSTSNQYRTRTWTVVALREQLQDRFAHTEFTEVNRHKFRRWKNPKPQESMVYTVVIRGSETKVIPHGANGLTRSSRLCNPWHRPDHAEIRRRECEECEQQCSFRQKRRSLSPVSRGDSPSYRSRSPSYRTRVRSPSPPSYRSWQSRYESPPPSVPYSRSDSPPPYQRSVRSGSAIGSRSPSVRIRVVPRYIPTDIEDTPSPPTPPETFTPPPGVSAYYRPGSFGTGMHGPSPAPFHPYPPLATPAIHPMSSGISSVGGPFAPHNAGPQLPPTPATCSACRATRSLPCAHYPRYLPCYRPVQWYAGVAYHPPCMQCSEQHQPPPPPPPPPLPQHFASSLHASPFAPFPQYHHPHHTRYESYHQQQEQQQHCTGFGSVLTPRPASWSSAASSVGPMPPAPNPFSPLSTPPLSSLGGSSSVGGSSPVPERARVRATSTPPRTEEREGGEEGEVIVGELSPAPSVRGGESNGGELE